MLQESKDFSSQEYSRKARDALRYSGGHHAGLANQSTLYATTGVRDSNDKTRTSALKPVAPRSGSYLNNQRQSFQEIENMNQTRTNGLLPPISITGDFLPIVVGKSTNLPVSQMKASSSLLAPGSSNLLQYGASVPVSGHGKRRLLQQFVDQDSAPLQMSASSALASIHQPKLYSPVKHSGIMIRYDNLDRPVSPRTAAVRMNVN